MTDVKIRLLVPWIRGGAEYAPGAVLEVPEVEAFNLEAAGYAVRIDERQVRVFDAPQIAATVGRPKGIKRRGKK